MTIYRIDLSEPAEKDMRNIIRYISFQLDAPQTAHKMMSILTAAINRLAEMPQKYPLVDDKRLSSMGYRKLIVKNYIIFFIIDENLKVVNLVRILYGRRDWLHIL